MCPDQTLHSLLGTADQQKHGEGSVGRGVTNNGGAGRSPRGGEKLFDLGRRSLRTVVELLADHEPPCQSWLAVEDRARAEGHTEQDTAMALPAALSLVLSGWRPEGKEAQENSVKKNNKAVSTG